MLIKTFIRRNAFEFGLKNMHTYKLEVADDVKVIDLMAAVIEKMKENGQSLKIMYDCLRCPTLIENPDLNLGQAFRKYYAQRCIDTVIAFGPNDADALFYIKRID